MDKSTFLCEECGYTLAGLAATGVCPECGTAISESQPERRPGSAWQQRPSFTSWWRTNAEVLRRPQTLFRVGKAEARRSTLLLVTNSLLAGLLISLPWTGTLIGDPSRGEAGVRGQALFLVMLAAWSALGGVVLLVLTLVEHYGIRFFAARRRWRLSIGAAWLVCGHASVGWLLGPVFAFAGLAGLFSFERVFGVSPHGTFKISLGSGLTTDPIGWSDLVYALILGGSALAGVLAFEILVYIGVRRCRFANAPAVAGSDVPETAAAPVNSL